MIVPAISWNYYEQRTNKTLFEYKEYQRNDYFPMITSDSIGSSFEQKTELILISENRAIVTMVKSGTACSQTCPTSPRRNI